MSIDNLDELAASIKGRKTILFVGAGVSVNLGVPSFSQVIDELASRLGFDNDIFKASGDSYTLAEYYFEENAGLDDLVDWMKRDWHPDHVDVGVSGIHECIVKLGFKAIYTTNYDCWLEQAFDYWKRPYCKITCVSEMPNASEEDTQIIKYHGDVESPRSLVLTESSYFERLSFESPLDVKLRSDILDKAILFIGYSLSDINIRYLLYRLQRQWEEIGEQGSRPKSYIFLARPNLVQERLLANRGVTPLVSDEDDPKVGLEKFLTRLLQKVVDK
ncbi:SIR2 family protein [Pseudidiomarina terrestris]|uniref:SIR2 family protein n=1 Tax=Pseudidiomarina terrestris TaxID=2820060 RepID=UPI0026531019|nr:SIR2 family protein [Pseudidiomarina sp. 1ASP75-5]MDN7134552.1 SIR2 family protein [Pseudidiomarina sp. 1ASP75-5]